jgi:hypothetical protein
MHRMARRERVPGVSRSTNSISSRSYRTVGTSSLDKQFEQVWQSACDEHAADHPIGLFTMFPSGEMRTQPYDCSSAENGLFIRQQCYGSQNALNAGSGDSGGGARNHKVAFQWP